MSFFLQGFSFGLMMTAPVGPLSILCIQRSIQHGIKAAARIGLGAAGAQIIFATIALLGFGSLTQWIIQHQTGFRVISACLLIVLAVKTWQQQAAPKTEPTSSDSKGASWEAFLLTLSNPMTIMSFIALLTSIGNRSPLSLIEAATFTEGIVIGSFLWRMLLGYSTTVCAKQLTNETYLHWINKISGLALGGYGLYFLIKTLT